MDSQKDSIAKFALDLRALRHERRDPTLTWFETRTGISKSTYSAAFRGNALPSEKTLRGIMETLEVDPTDWLERRAALAMGVPEDSRRESGEPSDSSLTDRAGDESTSKPEPEANVVSDRSNEETPLAAPVDDERNSSTTRFRGLNRRGQVIGRKAAIIIAAVTALVTAAVTSAVWGLVILPNARFADPTTSTVKNYVPYADGVDPMETVCREDAVIGGAQKRLDGAFLVEMLYSNQCMAAWGRVTRYDEQSAGNSMKMTVYPAVQIESPRTQERSAFNLQSLYTTLIIEPDVNARICGLAVVTQDDGKEQTLGPPLCI